MVSKKEFNKMSQKVWFSEWCPYNCEFCFNGKHKFMDHNIPKITSNCVEILDPAFLSKPNVLQVIKILGKTKYKGKVVYYHLRQGINYKDLTQEIANELKKSRFLWIRFAWDRRYNKKIMFKIVDCKNILLKAGYKARDLMCYILTNWKIPYIECKAKLRLLNRWGIESSPCIWRKNQGDPIIARMWDIETIKRFQTKDSRKINQIIRYGIDPEVK